MSQAKHIEKVAIVGATGHVGKLFAEELLKTGKHTVTAITRVGSKGVLPQGVEVAPVDYDDDGSSLTSALRGQQFLVITLAVSAPPDLHNKIVQAAAKAGVPYIMPNAFGFDLRNEKLAAEDLYGNSSIEKCEEVRRAGASPIYMGCGFWYEWSLALGEAWFGFDIQKRTVTFIDDGKTKINVSTWKQCGRALAALLSLPETGASPSVSEYKDKPLMIASFLTSQREMLDSLHRTLGTTDKDWAISYEPSEQRYQDGIKAMKSGQRQGFAKAMYTRIFFPNGDGDYESSAGIENEKLGLPKEDFDEVTKSVVDMLESGWKPW